METEAWQLSPRFWTFEHQFVVIDSCRWFIGLLGTVEGLVWDKSAFQRRLREGLATPKPVIRGTG